MKRKSIVIALLVLALLLPVSVFAVSITDLDSLVSLNRTGVGDSWFAMEMSGVSESRFIIGWFGLFAPTDFLLTLVDDYTVGITWVKGAGAENTMVRAKLGGVPTDRDDGYLVYYGTGESTTDDGVDFGTSVMYYWAWSQAESEVWETTGVGDSIGGTMIIFLLFGMLGLGLVFGFIWKKYAWLAYGAAGVWALLGFLALETSSSASPAEITDVYMGLFWLSIGFVIACSLLPTVMRDKPSPDDIYVDEIDEVTGETIIPEGPKQKKQRVSRFSKTGHD